MPIRRLNRSFVCLVDSARELQASLSEDEAGRWCCVWDKDSCMDWDTYTTTAFTGAQELCRVQVIVSSAVSLSQP